MTPTEGVGVRLIFSTEPGIPVTVFQRDNLRVTHQKGEVECLSFSDDSLMLKGGTYIKNQNNPRSRTPKHVQPKEF